MSSEKKIKKVLILAYDFPPYVSVGSLRPYSWYKYFKEFNIYPIVVTRQWGNKYGNYLDYIAPGESNKTIINKTEFGTIVRTPYKPNLSNRILLKYGKKKFRLFRKAITAYYEIMQFVFFIGTKSGIYHGAKEYLKSNNVDFIIVTGEPFVLFKYASKLSTKFNIPWIADYRDPWSQNSVRSSNWILEKFNQYNEKKYLKNANTITTVNDFFKYKIGALIKNHNVEIISNGFDSDISKECSVIKQNSDILNIGFVGTIYPWHPIESVFAILDSFIGQSKVDLCLNLYGINNATGIKILLSKFPYLSNKVKIYNKLPYEEMMNLLATNNLLLLFNYYSFIGTKIYDYLAVKRKILFCYTNDANADKLKESSFILKDKNWQNNSPQADLIKKTNSGILVKNKNHLHTVITELYKEFKESGEVTCNSVGIEDYSRIEQAKKLATLLKETN